MKLFAKVIITSVALLGLCVSAIAAQNNGEGAGAQSGNGQGGAQGGHQGEPRHRPCRADAQKFCQGIKPGEGRIIACLKENASKLSQACADRLAKAPNGQGKDKEPEEEGDEK